MTAALKLTETPHVLEFSHVVSFDSGVLRFVAHSDVWAKTFELTWDGERSAVVGWCALGSVEAYETGPLPAQEAFDVARWTECSVDVLDAYEQCAREVGL